jgi:hypothetical protein
MTAAAAVRSPGNASSIPSPRSPAARRNARTHAGQVKRVVGAFGRMAPEDLDRVAGLAEHLFDSGRC